MASNSWEYFCVMFRGLTLSCLGFEIRKGRQENTRPYKWYFEHRFQQIWEFHRYFEHRQLDKNIRSSSEFRPTFDGPNGSLTSCQKDKVLSLSRKYFSLSFIWYVSDNLGLQHSIKNQLIRAPHRVRDRRWLQFIRREPNSDSVLG